MKKFCRSFSAAACCLVLLTACSSLSTSVDSLLGEDFEVGALGCNAYISGEEGELEVPPDLSPPDDSDSLVVPEQGERVSASGAAFDSYVLPERLDMRVHRDGGISWLAVDTEPAALWPVLFGFLEENGFTVVENDPVQGYIVTAWRNRRVPVSPDGGNFAVLRTRLFVRVERDADAVTNVFFSAQDAGRHNGEWRLMASDPNLEHRVLMRFRVHLASGREVAGPKMASIDDIKTRLEINDFGGVAALTIGQNYSKVWRRLGVALGRSGMTVRADSRSRGIYLVEYDDRALGPLDADVDADDAAAPARTRLLQLHLLAKGDGETVVTVHRNGKNAAPLPYDFTQALLKRLVMAYSPRRVAAG